LTTDLLKQIHALKAYLHYWLVREDRHALQSPFAFELYDGLLIYAKKSQKDSDLEVIRQKLLNDSQLLDIEDFGAGSKKLKTSKRLTSQITKHSTTSRKFSLLYQYFCQQTPANQVLELGTCVGINTLYLSRVVKGTLYTLEGSKALFLKAQEYLSPQNTIYVHGNIHQTLPKLLTTAGNVDFALIDATHTYSGSVAYFNLILPHLLQTSILVLADIHWSKEMDEAWEEIKAHPSVTLSMDFYECGVLFFKKGIPKSHYILNY
jgi:predicted O-methyltransferase YrrM